MEKHETTPRPSKPDARGALERKIRRRKQLGQEIEFRGRTMDGSEGSYGVISLGAVEIYKLRRKDIGDTPLVTFKQTDSHKNGEEIHDFNFIFLALDGEGNLVNVKYNEAGERGKPELVGPWQQKEPPADKLGIPKFKDLPPNIDLEKMAMDFLTGYDDDTYKPPTIVPKAEPNKFHEYDEPEKDRVMVNPFTPDDDMTEPRKAV